MHVIDAERSTALRAAFRDEIGAAVRSASPFLISLLGIEGLTLDEAVMCLEPQAGWPRRPRLAGLGPRGHAFYNHVLRHYTAGMLVKGLSQPPLHGCRIEIANGGWIRMEVVDHSLEVSGRMGPVRFATRFGELRLELIEEIPQTVFIACRGRLLEKVVDHVALCGRGWRIDEIEEAEQTSGRQVLVVVTGSVHYRLPWARQVDAVHLRN